MLSVETIETAGLGDRSDLVADGAAVAIDPQRDTDRVLDMRARHGWRLTHVFETHVHNDYVAERPEPARRPGAEHVLPADSGAEFAHPALTDADLIGPAHTDELTRAQYRSVRRLAAELPASAQVFPTQGFGSFCPATPTSGTSSTIGGQAGRNSALTQDEQEYVDRLLAGCGSGYRATVAASILDRPGREIVLVDDSYDQAAKAGLEEKMEVAP